MFLLTYEESYWKNMAVVGSLDVFTEANDYLQRVLNQKLAYKVALLSLSGKNEPLIQIWVCSPMEY